MNRHNPKINKMKANNQRKIKRKKPYANMTQGYKMMINDNKKDLKQKNCCLPQIG
jgi:hypothetical protein